MLDLCSRKDWGPLSKICALKPDILLYPPEARYIKEPPPNLHRFHMSEESHGAHEIFFLFSCIQIDTCIQQLKHTSVMFCGVGSCCVGDGGIICIRVRELQWCHRVVPNIVIKSGTAGTEVVMQSFSSVQQTSIAWTIAKHTLITLAKSSSTAYHRFWISLLISSNTLNQQSILIYFTISRASFH